MNNPAGCDLGFIQMCQVIITNMFVVFVVRSEGF